MNILVVMALPLENAEAFDRESVPVLYTGVGKINAAHALTRRLTEYRCAGQPLPLVINFGTAGSRSIPLGTLVCCDAFVQRDMDVTALGVPAGTTPFEEVPARLEFPLAFDDLRRGTCGSGDSFSTAIPAVACDLVDMEAYALAKVCRLEGARFACVKYITDNADDNAHKEWVRNVHRASEDFLALYQTLLRRV